MASVDFEQVSKRFDNVEVVQDLSLQVRDVVLYAGVIQQLGTPQDLYERPANNFVAGFIGRKVTLGIRPEQLEGEQAAARGHAGNDSVDLASQMVPVRVDVVENLGKEQNGYSMLKDQHIVAQMDARRSVRPGDEITLSFDMQHCHLFDPHDGRSITSLLREESSGSTEQAHDAEALGA